jgi:hypothetical protein
MDNNALVQNREAEKRLLRAIFEPKEEIEGMEMTNLFRITDMDKFKNIINHIQNDNGVFVVYREDKVGISANDTICNAVPLNIDSSLVKEYDGDNISTLKLLQEILPDGEMIVLQATSYTVGKEDIISTTIKVTNKEIRTL